jgi:dihydrofolate synthase/folylpolyglutamate synthase
LCEALRAYYPGRRILFIVNMLRDKDAAGMLREIGRIADTLIVTQTAARRAASAEQLWAQARENSAVGTILAAPGGIDDALAQARSLIGPRDVICVTGSLHLVAAVEKTLASPS